MKKIKKCESRNHNRVCVDRTNGISAATINLTVLCRDHRRYDPGRGRRQISLRRTDRDVVVVVARDGSRHDAPGVPQQDGRD